jgi:hypothetical protein
MRSVHNQDHFRFRRAAFYSQLKSKVGNTLAKATAPAYQPGINLNMALLYLHAHSLTPPTHKPLTSYSLPSP